MRRRFLAFFVVFCFSCANGDAFAALASKEYVDSIVQSLNVQSDWNEDNTTSPAYIKNKPQIPDVSDLESITNKVNVISDAATSAQYPTVGAVVTALADKADVDDVRFDTIPTAQPSGTPPTGQVFIWFD